ncbi:lysylphosphatidylglycerol synthase transmembrane domain-containing protein [Arthrobacter alpinus]|uniref:lysylphosphatidylglycerol synthase transmembrane domain-containing protein n=1 Tax=Arthrobacter alpinus TaxID=656366 RepID=UPI001364CB5C
MGVVGCLGTPDRAWPLLTVYALGNILATLPLTPGGLGIVEGVMAPALVGFGIPAEIAVLGVIGWRLYQFWLPLPLGALAYLSLRLGPFDGDGARPGEDGLNGGGRWIPGFPAPCSGCPPDRVSAPGLQR